MNRPTNTIYLDNAATTPMHPEVITVMTEVMKNTYGNASSVYHVGQDAKAVLEEARSSVAQSLNCLPNEVYFTGCGSEADNWAIKGYAMANRKKGNHIITTKIEHHAILHPCEYLEKNGFEVTYLPVDETGLVSLEDVKNAIKDTTILISVMYANNEVGTIEPIAEIAKIAKEHGVCMHTDAVQAVGAEAINFQELGVDMLSLSGHKFGGPKGVGALIIRKGLRIEPFMHGGAQERSKRAGTENLAGIVGLAKALEISVANIPEKQEKMKEMRDYLISEIEKNIPYIKFNGHREHRLANNVNFCFRYIEGESLLLMLDINGICASSGSACTSGSLDPSHVLLALGLPHEIAHGSLRLTLSANTTKEELDFTVSKLQEIVHRLRLMSPIYDMSLEEN
ncbi:MAG: cysteine desulfurase NifS [Clostridia bacterium]|nr:cysteine desulfurase NifS [Clostridia bacterium]